MTAAAPAPWIARAPSNSPASGASAQAAEASVNSVRPALNTRTRPSRSPSAAAVTIPAAYVSAYALTVHSSVGTPTCSSRWIAGSAVVTTSASSATMKNAIAQSAIVQRGDERWGIIGAVLLWLVLLIWTPAVPEIER